MMERWLTATQAATQAGVGVNAIYTAVHIGRLRHRRAPNGRYILTTRPWVRAWQRAKKQGPQFPPTKDLSLAQAGALVGVTASSIKSAILSGALTATIQQSSPLPIAPSACPTSHNRMGAAKATRYLVKRAALLAWRRRCRGEYAPIVSTLSRPALAEVVAEVKRTTYQAAADHYGWSKFTILRIMQKARATHTAR